MWNHENVPKVPHFCLKNPVKEAFLPRPDWGEVGKTGRCISYYTNKALYTFASYSLIVCSRKSAHMAFRWVTVIVTFQRYIAVCLRVNHLASLTVIRIQVSCDFRSTAAHPYIKDSKCRGGRSTIAVETIAVRRWGDHLMCWSWGGLIDDHCLRRLLSGIEAIASCVDPGGVNQWSLFEVIAVRH